MFLSARWWMRGLQYLRRKLRIKSRSFTSWLKNCVLAGRGGRCRQRKMLIYSRSEGEKKTTPRIMSFRCTYSILVPVCIALSCVQKMDSEPLLNFRACNKYIMSKRSVWWISINIFSVFLLIYFILIIWYMDKIIW